MSFEEACRELGVDPAALPSPSDLKRLYLRGLRTRNPERHADAFRRWRDAYELLSQEDSEPQAWPEVRTQVAPGASAAAPDTGPATAQPEKPDGPDEPGGSGPSSLREVRDLFTQATEAGDPDLPVAMGAGWILSLIEEDDVHGARELATVVDQWLQATGAELRLEANDAVRWCMTSELATVSEGLTVAVRTAIAQAIADDDLDAARPAVRGFREEDPDHALHTERILRAAAPTLHEVYKAELIFSNEGVQYTPVSRAGTYKIVIAVAALLAVGLALRMWGQ